MDKELIKRACSLGEERNLPVKCKPSMPSIVREELERWKPGEFLVRHNPDVGHAVVRLGTTSGELALNGRIPTLANVAEVYGTATVKVWLTVQLDSVDTALGATALGALAREEAVKLIMTGYKDVNVGNLLQFFVRYKMGEYNEAVAHYGGLQKLMSALRLYLRTRDDDARRVARERDNEKAWRERQEREKRVISYEEYVASCKNDNCT